MKPVPIPDGLSIEGGVKREISGKAAGAEDIEAIVTDQGDSVVISALIECDDIDMRSLHFDRRFWLHFHGAPILPFSLDTAFVSPVADPNDAVTKDLQTLGKLLAAAWSQHSSGNRDATRLVISRIQDFACDMLDIREGLSVVETDVHGGVVLGLKNGRVVHDATVNGRTVGTVEVDIDDDPSHRAAPELPGDDAGEPST